jgi:hypothetical protein
MGTITASIQDCGQTLSLQDLLKVSSIKLLDTSPKFFRNWGASPSGPSAPVVVIFVVVFIVVVVVVVVVIVVIVGSLVCQKISVRCCTNHRGRFRRWRWDERVRREVTEGGVNSKKIKCLISVSISQRLLNSLEKQGR